MNLQQGLNELKRRRLERFRQRAAWQRDPLQFAPDIAYDSPQLGLHPLFEAGSDDATLRWLASPLYSAEAVRLHPIDLCHYAMALYHSACVKDDASLSDAFLEAARTVYDRAEWRALPGGTCLVLPHLYDVPGYAPHEVGWISASVQGWMLSIFLRAFQLSPAQMWLDAAHMTLRVFDVTVAEGGVRHVPAGHADWVVYEKYAFPGQCRMVLNGTLSALFGLHEMAVATGEPLAQHLFEQGLATVRHPKFLPAYDTGHISLYDLGGSRRITPACVYYTWVHARQLGALSLLTSERALMDWALKFRGYGRNWRYRWLTNLHCAAYRATRLPAYMAMALQADPRAEPSTVC